MPTNEKLELIHLRAIVAIMREALSMHPLPDFATWAADMKASGWNPYAIDEWAWAHSSASGVIVFISIEEAVALYADGETPDLALLQAEPS